MAVHLVDSVEHLLDDYFEHATDNMVSIAKGTAPVDTGNLRGHIHKRKLALGNYIISTNSVGHNNVEYPAKIEFGEAVDGYQAFKYRGRFVKTYHVNGSSRSHFMKNAIDAYKGTYTGK